MITYQIGFHLAHIITNINLMPIEVYFIVKIILFSFIAVVFPPPKSIQLLAMKRNQLTVHWQHPPEINSKFAVVMNYQVLLMLQDHKSTCRRVIKKVLKYCWM